MATLTVAELAHIRQQTGDTCEPYDVSDEYIVWLHDNRASSEPLCAFDAEPLGSTIVWVLRARARKAQRLTDGSSEAGSASLSQKRKHIKEDLDEWESKCGFSGGVITIDTLDMGLDSDCEGSEYAPYPYRGYWHWMGY